MEMLFSNATVLATLLEIIAGLVAVLIVLLGWIGTRVHDRLDEISKCMQNIDKELRVEITTIQNRVALLEFKDAVSREKG